MDNNNNESTKFVSGQTLSGQRIYSYNDNQVELKRVEVSHVERVTQHIEKYLGPIIQIAPDTSDSNVGINLVVVGPTEEIPYYKFVTAGMSDKQMSLLEGENDKAPERYLELMILLPLTWKLDAQSLTDNNWIWPINLLHNLAWFVHAYDTRLGSGHTVSNGPNALPYAENTKLNNCLILPSISCPEEFRELKINEDKTIYFYNLYPLYKEEAQYKLDYGTDELCALFDKYQIADFINPKRKNTAKKNWFF